MAATTQQDNWRHCIKCRGLFWNGAADKGQCPAGGAHDGSHSWNFFLPADPHGLGDPQSSGFGDDVVLNPVDE
jgi:hypothetical protein